MAFENISTKYAGRGRVRAATGVYLSVEKNGQARIQITEDLCEKIGLIKFAAVKVGTASDHGFLLIAPATQNTKTHQIMRRGRQGFISIKADRINVSLVPVRSIPIPHRVTAGGVIVDLRAHKDVAPYAVAAE